MKRRDGASAAPQESTSAAMLRPASRVILPCGRPGRFLTPQAGKMSSGLTPQQVPMDSEALADMMEQASTSFDGNCRVVGQASCRD